jgi:hypothetical protein
MTTPLQDHLDRVEHSFNEAATVLATGDAPALADASATLHALVLELAPLLGGAQPVLTMDAAQRHRIVALAQGMGVLRESLARRSAYVHQALQVVVPTPAPSTYGKSSSPFGAVAPQSGQFKVLAA